MTTQKKQENDSHANFDRSTMRSAEAAYYLNLSESTLAKMRCHGGDGPVYIKLGRRILYRKQDLDDWLRSRRAVSTSDADTRLPKRLAYRESEPGTS